MRKHWAAFFVLVFAAWAANVKLYMKDGSYHIVREYQVQSDRVHFYSVERSQWEDIPLELIDLKRTQTEAEERQSKLDADAKVIEQEEKVEREMEKETSRIPQDPGVYWLDGNQAKPIKLAETTVHTNKGRSVLAKLAPIPVVSGKGTLELKGESSANVFTNPEQELFLQLAETERFGLCKLTVKGPVRIVENLTTMPVTNEVVEEPVMVPSFQKQLSPGGLYKIWPKEPLPAGEYAVVEYTEGKLNIQVWDFAIKPGSK